jgi:hypothetical protein
MIVCRDRGDLLDEFLRNPLGPHSPELTRVVLYLRSRSKHQRQALVELEANRQYCIATLPDGHRGTLEIDESRIFTSIAEAETEVFLRRWQHWELEQGC